MPYSAFAEALSQLPEALRKPVQDAWDSYWGKGNDAVGSLPDDDSDFMTSLCRVWAASRFVAESCRREPALLRDLLETGDLRHEPRKRPRAMRFDMSSLASEAELMSRLRRFRRREMVRIAWRDIAGWADLQETLADLSILAETCIQAAHDVLFHEACKRRGTPVREDGTPQGLVILGMGKLGAWELNYSSDVDLIFAYSQDGVLADKKGTSYGEFFTRLARSLVKVLDEMTQEGFVYRVDTRLRPFGESGPLVMSFDGMESYYQSQAREWERYAMIKVRAVGGDLQAGGQLLEMLRPFVYRRYLDYGAFEELRSMKFKITQELQRRDRMDNIKLGPGGIREIEFIGQAFQLIRGGREKALRDRRILVILNALAELSVMPAAVVKKLIDGYHFLRLVENRLQQYADQQVHDLPMDPEGRLRLAFSLGFADWSSFKRRLDDVRTTVHGVFEQVFESPQSGEGNSVAQAIWVGGGEPKQLLGALGEMGYSHPQEAFEVLQRFKGCSAVRKVTAKGGEHLDRLMPMLVEAVGGVGHSETTLKRILDLLEAIAGRQVYISLLLENPLALSQLIKLASASPWIAEYLARYPILLDGLLDPAALYVPLTRSELKDQLTRQLESVGEDNLEEQMSVLRHFKQASVLRVAAADIMDVMTIMVVSDCLTEIAEVVVDQVLTLAWRLLADKHGVPPGASPETPSGFGIIAFGKLGGIELGYGSDLDLVFLYDGDGSQAATDGPRPLAVSQFYGRLGQRIINILNTKMHAGVLYDVDLRLRPCGNAGLLVSHVDAYEHYQESEAWTWEHQSLVRARFVAGDPCIGRRFEQIRRKVLCRPRDLNTLRQEVKEMREKMRSNLDSGRADAFDLKQGVGGIADIEFLVQYEILGHACEDEGLIKYTDNIRQLKALARAGVLSAEEAETLKQAYCAFRDCGHRQTLQHLPAVVDGEEFKTFRARVRRIWDRVMA